MSANTYCVKYEIACSIGVPRIIWCSGPYKGAGNDGTIASVGCVASYLNENEAIAADKAYRFLGPRFVTPFAGVPRSLTKEQIYHNYLFYAFRQTVERVIMRLKIFGIFCVRWRYSLLLHQLAVKVLCKLINLFLIVEPLG